MENRKNFYLFMEFFVNNDKKNYEKFQIMEL